jgi:hypothetical protein
MNTLDKMFDYPLKQIDELCKEAKKIKDKSDAQEILRDARWQKYKIENRRGI